MIKFKIISNTEKEALDYLSAVHPLESNPLYSLIFGITNLTAVLPEPELFSVRMKFLMKYVEYLGMPEMWAKFDEEKHVISDLALPGIQEILYSDSAISHVSDFRNLINLTVFSYQSLFNNNVEHIEHLEEIESYLRLIIGKMLDAPIASQLDREAIKALCKLYTTIQDKPLDKAGLIYKIRADISSRISFYLKECLAESVISYLDLFSDLYDNENALLFFRTEFPDMF